MSYFRANGEVTETHLTFVVMCNYRSMKKILILSMFFVLGACSTEQDFSGNYLVWSKKNIKRTNSTKTEILKEKISWAGMGGGLVTEYQEYLPVTVKLTKNEDKYSGQLSYYDYYNRPNGHTKLSKNELKLTNFQISGDSLFFETESEPLTNLILNFYIVQGENVLLAIDKDLSKRINSDFELQETSDFNIYQSSNRKVYDSLRSLGIKNQISATEKKIKESTKEIDRRYLKADIELLNKRLEEQL